MAPQVVSLLTIIEHQDFNPAKRVLARHKLTPVLANIIGKILQQPVPEDQLIHVKPLANKLFYLVQRENKSKRSWAQFKDKCRQELASSQFTVQVLRPIHIFFLAKGAWVPTGRGPRSALVKSAVIFRSHPLPSELK